MKLQFFLIAFFIGLASSYLITPLIIKLSVKLKFFDQPGPRKIHTHPVPLGGGASIYLSFIVSLIIMFFVFCYIMKPESVKIVSAKSIYLLIGIFISGTLILILGLIDDLKDVSAKLKLVIQIILALFLYYLGFSIDFVTNPFTNEIIYLNKYISISITLLWIVGLMNALNLLDGLDGLLAGVAAISGIVFAVVAGVKSQFLVAILMMVMSGVALGFLKYNFHPAKIFLGDSGSLFIGLIFAALSITGALKSTAALAIFIPVCIMGLPIIDVTFAVFRRFFSKKPIFKADKDHLHHRLLKSGFSQTQAVITIYIITALLGLLGLYMAVVSK